MMTRMLLLCGGVGLLFGVYQFRRWSAQVGPAHTAQAMRWAGLTAALIVLLILLARGGSALIIPLLPLLIPLLLRWRSLLQTVFAGYDRTGFEEGNGASSTVETYFLRMSLDHASGEMSGTVLAGEFKGATLDQLNLQQLLHLRRDCQTDAQSVAVLEAYLDRIHGDVWRAQEDTPSDSPSGATNDVQEACDILGLRPGATPAEIKAAHRRLMQRMHPDHGGSAYLAARINWARDFLLGG
ncbi:MAG: molecular chaperone DnaJ [Candidatus Competibacteraceae bacterium]|jgi:hypothetical protein|nr:molecular chaperone DnaJ [Candidatus Competibacteraceae bacterium]